MYSLTDVDTTKLDLYDIFGVISPNAVFSFKMGNKKYKIGVDGEGAAVDVLPDPEDGPADRHAKSQRPDGSLGPD